VEPGYTLTELCDLAGVSARTVRYYVAEGLLRTPGQGPGVRYGEDHLARLRLIRRLQREHLPLAEIRNRLRGLSDEDVRSVASAPAGDATPGSAIDYVRGVLAGRGVTGRDIPRIPPPVPAVMPSPAVSPARAPDPVARLAAVARPATPPEAPALAGSDQAEAAATTIPPVEPERSQWERIALTTDIEVHVRRPMSRLANRQLARILESAREILREDTP
jgi:DNA-binding transcriptional MerR regulator